MSGSPRMSSRPTVSTFFDASRSRIHVNCIGDGIVIIACILLPSAGAAEVVSTDVARSTEPRPPSLLGGLMERSRETRRAGWNDNASSASSSLTVGFGRESSSFDEVVACASCLATVGISSRRRLCDMPFSIFSATLRAPM